MYDSVVCFMFIVKCSTINMKYKRNYNGVLQIINKIRSVINITWQYFYSTMQITHTHAENANFQAVNKNKQMLLSWSLIAYLSIFFLCIAISYEIIETFYTNTNLSFLRTGLTTILNCLVSYKTKKEHSYEFLSYCKIPIPQREFSIVTVPYVLSYWNSLLNGKLICWRKVWLLPQKYHRRNKIKEVSYKLIHRF